MFSSLPDYRRFAEATLQRLRMDPKQKTSDRLGGMVINIVLLAGLWGVPLYARWLILSDVNSTQPLSEAVLGKWRRDDRDILEFTRRGELHLIRNEVMVESADYRIEGDILEVSGFTEQPDDRPLPVVQQRYQIAIRGARLIIKPAPSGVNWVPDRRHAEGGNSLLFVLPPWSGVTAHFQRMDDR